MSRYIDKEALEKAIEKFDTEFDCYDHYDTGYYDCLCAVEDIIGDMPEADVVEVKHGKWSGGFYCYKCSVCSSDNHQYRSKFCPECGARMDGDEE